ncbi:MAG: GNAT family N-acetyltransferase [Streptosporangiaceae bacterium]
MAWTLTEDLEEFTTAASSFLRERPAQNTVALTIMATLGTSGLGYFGAHPPMFGWWKPPGGTVTAACLQTPPFPLLLSSGPPAAFDELAATLADAGRTLPGVNGGEAGAQRFAAQWQQLTGAGTTVSQRHRMYRLGALVPPRPAPEGHDKLATPADRDLVIEWFAAFGEEAGTLAARGTEQAARMAGERIDDGCLTLWEVAGEPVSMAGVTRQVAGMVRVGPVYTPPKLRRHGYAAAVTAAISQAALDAGAAEVLLFTDLANPTSNGVYLRLGYHPVEDRVLLAFDPTPSAH